MSEALPPSKPAPHYEAALERDLQQLHDHIREMARLVLRALQDAARALQGRDRRLAYTVILADNRIDALENRIDRMCQEFLVRHMPVGRPLRFVLATIKVNAELERMGDYADAIAHRIVTLHAEQDIPALSGLTEMFEKAIAVLSESVEAFVTSDVARAQAVLVMESEIDAMNHAIFQQLSHPDHGEKDLTKRFAVLAILNRLERVADRAVNVAEDGIWVARGEIWRAVENREQRVLFVSPADATLGPMAEAIARAKAPLHLSFASCGIHPAPLNPAMVTFMARRGYEISRPRPRAIGDVGTLEEFYVVVTVSQEAEDGCPELPYRTIQLFWDIPDPSRITGDADAVEAAFQEVYDSLQVKIADLIGAIVGAKDRA